MVAVNSVVCPQCGSSKVERMILGEWSRERAMELQPRVLSAIWTYRCKCGTVFTKTFRRDIQGAGQTAAEDCQTENRGSD